MQKRVVNYGFINDFHEDREKIVYNDKVRQTKIYSNCFQINTLAKY